MEHKLSIMEQLRRAYRQLDLFLRAEEEVAVNQSYSIAGRTYTRANLKEIGERIDYWMNKVEQLETKVANTSGRNRIYRAIPRDL